MQCYELQGGVRAVTYYPAGSYPAHPVFGEGIWLPAFSLCIQMLQSMEDTFMKKQNARQRTIVGNKKQPAASLCILYMNKAEIL